MKAIARFTLLLLLLFVLASSGAWADTILVGSLDLTPTNPGAYDSLSISNFTGFSSPFPDQGLTFSNIQLSINGVAQTVSDIPAMSSTSIDNLLYNSITSLGLSGTLTSSTGPLIVTVNGITEQLSSTFTITGYTGPGNFDTGGACTAAGMNCPHYDITAQGSPVPEPITLALLGASLPVFLLRRRKAKA